MLIFLEIFAQNISLYNYSDIMDMKNIFTKIYHLILFNQNCI